MKLNEGSKTLLLKRGEPAPKSRLPRHRESQLRFLKSFYFFDQLLVCSASIPKSSWDTILNSKSARNQHMPVEMGWTVFHLLSKSTDITTTASQLSPFDWKARKMEAPSRIFDWNDAATSWGPPSQQRTVRAAVVLPVSDIHSPSKPSPYLSPTLQ